MYVRAEGIWESEVNHEQHYGFEAPFVFSNYYFFWKYHTHPRDRDTYMANLQKYTTDDYQMQGIFPVFLQGHPTLFPLIISVFPNKAKYHLQNPDSTKFLKKTAEGYVLVDSLGPADIELIESKEDGSVVFLRNIGDARTASVLFGTLMILIVFVVSKVLYDRKTAYLSAALLAFALPVVNMVRLSDNESIMVVFLFTATFFYIRAFAEGKTQDFILAGILQGLAMGTKFTAFALFPIVLIFMAITRTREMRAAYSFIISFVVLSLFSHPASAFQEVISPSALKVGSVGEYIAGLNPYPIFATMLVLLYLFISKYPLSNNEKMMAIYMLFFSLMPFLESHRQYVLVPLAAMIISAVSVRNIDKITPKVLYYTQRL